MQSSLVSSLNSIATTDAASPSALPTSGAAPAFSGLIKDAVSSEQVLENQASSAVEGLMNGSGVDIHQAMIATQKADLAFEMALAVRNKAVAAYQQVMQMQF
ncbi:MAG TPA: flagellar hook-basal body complex protein FliE [Silvibacterium sp.]|nr:flagellar hook-basal body complex protein FliE [Silvibacterium sp.]